MKMSTAPLQPRPSPQTVSIVAAGLVVAEAGDSLAHDGHGGLADVRLEASTAYAASRVEPFSSIEQLRPGTPVRGPLDPDDGRHCRAPAGRRQLGNAANDLRRFLPVLHVGSHGAACRDSTWAGYTGRRCRSEACSVGSWRQCGGISTGPSASAIRQQTRKPVRRKRCRKRQPQRRTMIGRDERSAIDERGGDAPRLTFAGVQDCRDVAARQFAPEENGFEARCGDAWARSIGSIRAMDSPSSATEADWMAGWSNIAQRRRPQVQADLVEQFVDRLRRSRNRHHLPLPRASRRAGTPAACRQPP